MYLVKLKEGGHMTQIVVEAPNTIQSQGQFLTSTTSPNEKIHLEFYHM